MTFLLAGEFEWDFYEEACAKALRLLGHEVICFSWKKYFKSILGKFENKYIISFINTKRLNDDLFKFTLKHKPDVLFIWRGRHIWAETLKKIKEKINIILVSYNNDDPFSPFYSNSPYRFQRHLWTLFKSCIPIYDLHFVYRSKNISEFKHENAKYVSVFLPYYIPWLHRPVKLSEDENNRYKCDVVFVGHYENDNRLDYIRAMVKEGFHVKVFGGSTWTRNILGDLYNYFGDIKPVYNDDYPKALTGANVCLSFHSKINCDTYTRRSFEIPACKCLMLSERTSDLMKIFKEGVEAVYFSSIGELVEKVKNLLADEALRKEIASAGHERCISDGHDIVNRMRGFVSEIQSLIIR